jgi:hypothetical protein
LVNVSFAVDLPLVSVALSLSIRLRQVSAKEEMTMSINAILFDLFSTTTFPISVPAALTVSEQPLAMAAAPLVIGLGAWAATVMGIAMVFQDGRLRKRQATKAGDGPMAPANSRRPFSASAQTSVIGKSS